MNPEIKIPQGWTNVIYHTKSQQYLDTMLLNGLIAGGIGRKEGRHAWFSAAHPQESKAAPERKSWEPQLVPYFHHKWHTDTIYDIDLVKAKEMDLKCNQTFSYAVVHFGRHSSSMFCKSRYNHTNNYERPPEVAPHALAIQADVRAPGDQLFDQEQQHKRLDLIRSGVDSLYNLRTKMS